MKEIKYLHIMHNEKFIGPYIEFLKKNFNFKEHQFFIIDGKDEEIFKIPDYENVYFYRSDCNKRKSFEILKLMKFLYKILSGAEKIYFHSLFNKRIILFLFIFRKFLKRSNWIIWGGDIYCYQKRKNNLKSKVWYIIEDYTKGNFYSYITEFEGDYELTQKWFGAKGKYFDCFQYPSNLYKEVSLNQTEVKKECIYIQIGNSADPSNNHFEILKKLEKYKDKNIIMYCPLSYGDVEYAEKVINQGKIIFKEKFIPIVEFLDYERYLTLLSKIDIAIFAHNRQQAFGNITSLLSMKKTIYLRDEVTTTKMLKKLGIKIKSFDNLEKLEVFDEMILERNKKIMKKRFSVEQLVEEWKKIFKEKGEK